MIIRCCKCGEGTFVFTSGETGPHGAVCTHCSSRMTVNDCVFVTSLREAMLKKEKSEVEEAATRNDFAGRQHKTP